MTRRNRRENDRNEYDRPFSCANCGRIVAADAPGTRHRNHCPHCLSSLHVDLTVGDRRSGCRSVMDAIAVWIRESGEWSIVFRCRACGRVNVNRVAGDDDEAALRRIALRPVRAMSGA